MTDLRSPSKVNLAEKLDAFSEHWSPQIVARYNDDEVRLVKTRGECIWHMHDETDELFLILEGELDMDCRVRVDCDRIRGGPGRACTTFARASGAPGSSPMIACRRR